MVELKWNGSIIWLNKHKYGLCLQHNTIQYNTIQYNTIQYNTIQYNTIQYNTIQYIWFKEGMVTPEQDIWLTLLAPEQGILFGIFYSSTGW